MKYQQLCIKKRREFDQTIYDLKKLGLTYVEITRELENKDIIIQCSTVRSICIKMFASKNEELKKGGNMFEALYMITGGDMNYLKILVYMSENNIIVSKDIIKKIFIYTIVYDMKKRHSSGLNILEHIRKLGFSISYGEIRRMCYEIYEWEPKLKTKYVHDVDYSIGIDQRIYDLRATGMSFKGISESLAAQGICITRQRVEQRYKRYLTYNSIN